jgi:Xaa-Pro dipeptidase
MITSEKLEQAAAIVAEAGIDVWLTFVRETADGGDPVLPLILDGGLTWQSALMVSKTGMRVAVVGNYDADPLKASGDWHEVVPYVQSIREPLIEALSRLIPDDTPTPRIAVNYSVNDPKADGLSHGMYLLLTEYLKGTRFEHSLVSAEPILIALRSRKTTSEMTCIRGAITETERLFEEVSRFARLGMSEREVYDFVQARMNERGLGYGWDKEGDPIVNSGPDSMAGHGVPSETIRIEPGHIFHIDLGVIKDGYSSDIQRCWYVPHPGETGVPDDVQRSLDAVNGAISAGAAVLCPGVEGWQVDEAARNFIQAAGYPEYMHALGHQVGRVAHDGGAILGPRWERYGTTPMMKVERDHVYTLELGVFVEGRGYLGIEEMVRVTDTGVEWLSKRQEEIATLRSQ